MEEPTRSTAYGLAATRMNETYERNAQHYKKPTMVAKLPPHADLNEGAKYEQIDVGKIENQDYYDGGKKLRLA